MNSTRLKWLRALALAALTLAVAAPVALAAVYKTGSYSGKGTERNNDFTGRSVKFSVGKGKITGLKIAFRVECSNQDLDNPDKPDFDEKGTATASTSRIRVKKDGSFLLYNGEAEIKAPGDPRLGRIFFKGKLKGGRAEGTMMVSYQKDVTPGYDNPDDYEYYCGGGVPVKFKAKR